MECPAFLFYKIIGVCFSSVSVEVLVKLVRQPVVRDFLIVKSDFQKALSYTITKQLNGIRLLVCMIDVLRISVSVQVHVPVLILGSTAHGPFDKTEVAMLDR
mgnify:CR=1 FL=1